MNRILILITKGEIGGAQVSVFNLAKQLKERGYDVTVGYGSGTFLREKLDSAGIAAHHFPTLTRSHGLLANLRFMREFRAFLKAHSFDIVHFNSSNTLFGALAAKTLSPAPKTVFTFRGLSLIDPNYTGSAVLKHIYLFVFKTLLRCIDAGVFVSKENEQTAKQFRIEKKCSTIYNGLDKDMLEFLPREEARAFFEKHIDVSLADTTVIGSIGRLAYQKNYEFLIDAAATLKDQYPHVTYLIVGDGPEREAYEALIKKHQLEQVVYLCGAIPDAYKYAQAFDIFTLPSRYEGLSITLIEMLFAGLPILASDVGGAREQLGNDAMLFPLNNKKEYLNKLQNLIENENLRAFTAERSAQMSQKFTIQKTAEGYSALFDSLTTHETEG